MKSGDNGEEDPPVPIPNTEVKLFSAEDTWRETAWESRTLPVFYCFDERQSFDCLFPFLQKPGSVTTFRKYGFLRSSMRHRRKEGNHETCRAAPARYMDVAVFFLP